MKISIFSPDLVFLDFFSKLKAELKQLVKKTEIATFCSSLSKLSIIFADIENDTRVLEYVSLLDLPEEEIEGLNIILGGSFKTSFSYGYKEKEFVFIRLERDSSFLEEDHRSALKGLIIHELLHSVQRQRGLEVRLRNSLVFSLEFFGQLASLIPPGTFEQEEILRFLREISQMTLYTLKDIFVNVEMIKRGYCSLLLDYISVELSYDHPEKVLTPKFDTPFEKGHIRIKDLSEFARAFNFTITLIPTWLPAMVLEVDAFDYQKSRNLKHFVFDKYYTNPSLITREMWHIENIFLTSFAFAKSFHVKWFGALFNLALEYLLGEDFVFYHLSKASELVDQIYSEINDLEQKKLAITPILKAAYVQKSEYPSGIQQHNIDELLKLMQEYNIDKEEIAELEEILAEEETQTGHFFQDLLQLSIMILARDLKRVTISGQVRLINLFGRAIFTLLQVISHLGDECDNIYYHEVRLTTKRLIRVDNFFKKIDLVLYLENITKAAIFLAEEDPTTEEVKELLFNFDFFDVPLTNAYIDSGLAMIRSTKIVMNRVPPEDPEFPEVVSQFIGIIISEEKFDEEELEYIDMILVCAMIATKNIPFKLIQPVLEAFMSVHKVLDSGNKTDQS